MCSHEDTIAERYLGSLKSPRCGHSEISTITDVLHRDEHVSAAMRSPVWKVRWETLSLSIHTVRTATRFLYVYNLGYIINIIRIEEYRAVAAQSKGNPNPAGTRRDLDSLPRRERRALVILIKPISGLLERR